MEKIKKIFSKIYDQNIEKIYRFIFLKVNSQEIAQDLTSETFLRAFETFKEKAENQEIKNPRAFLYKIAKNLIIDYYRQKDKFQVISAENTVLIDPRQNLEEDFAKNSEFEKVRTALSQLEEDYQNVLIWYYLEEIPVKEIAKMLDRTESATRVLIHRALNSLREKLQIQNL